MKITKTTAFFFGLLFMLGLLSGFATTFSKGDPVQIITSERESIVGKLNSSTEAETIEVLGKDGPVTIDRDLVIDIRLLKDDAKTQWRNEVLLSGTRGTVDATSELASYYTNFFTERDIRTSSGFTSFAQVVLDEIHPTTTFKSLRINQVNVTYISGRPRTYENIRQVALRITLNWDGWIQKNGYTQVSITWDTDIERWIDLGAISSSGLDWKEATEATTQVAIAAGTLLYYLLSD